MATTKDFGNIDRAKLESIGMTKDDARRIYASLGISSDFIDGEMVYAAASKAVVAAAKPQYPLTEAWHREVEQKRLAGVRGVGVSAPDYKPRYTPSREHTAAVIVESQFSIDAEDVLD